MKIRFQTCLMTSDWKVKTQIINGTPDIVVREPDDSYSYEQILQIVKDAHKIERLQYGWIVQFTKNNQNKEVFLRDSHSEKINQTTSSKQSILKWLEFLFDMEIALF